MRRLWAWAGAVARKVTGSVVRGRTPGAARVRVAARLPEPERGGSQVSSDPVGGLAAGEPQSRGTVLVVDDDTAIQRVARRVLSGAGYDVLVAGDGTTGVALYREYADRVRCALVDLSMPGMSGADTIAALRAITPTLPVVIASGYDERHTGAVMTDARTAFVEKPFTIGDLVSAVQRVVAGAG